MPQKWFEMKIKIVGFSSSLRNARSGNGAEMLINELQSCVDKGELETFIEKQSSLRLEQFMVAGRAENKSFNEIFKSLRRLRMDSGLSNSEVALAAALWGAAQTGAEIQLVPLMDYFPADGSVRDLEKLREIVLGADGVILATPVYFGDRSSQCQRLIDFIRLEPSLRDAAKGKVMVGVSVGAKRNGGQETALIFQMLDMMENGFLGVGNDSETTSQYGGTCHAGDVGSIAKDQLGLNTAIGSGRRVAKVSAILAKGRGKSLLPGASMGFWILQDRDHFCKNLLEPFVKELEQSVRYSFVQLEELNIKPCMTCDICPSRIGPDEEYRCMRGSNKDDMKSFHKIMLSTEILVPTIYSPVDRTGLLSNYQAWIERTRYIRRGDYALSNRLVVPLTIEEVGAREHMNIRMVTSLIRHHTVVHKPIVAWIHEGELLNPEQLRKDLLNAALLGSQLLQGRFVDVCTHKQMTAYKPVGYILSYARDNTSKAMKSREKAITIRYEQMLRQSRKRLQPS